jgi:ABC-type transport system involved in multi-copper enzyme maturation permease subunit
MTFVALVKKDWRLFRVPVVATVLLGAIAYAACSIMYEIDWRHVEENVLYHQPQLSNYMASAATFGLWTVAVMAAAYGGSAFATERRERWGDFLSLLPPGRWQVVVSKLFVAVGCIAASAAVHAVILIVAHAARWPDITFGLGIWSAAVLMLFGVAWLCSTWLNSAAISASVAIALTICIGALLATWFDSGPSERQWGMELFGAIAVTVGAVCVIGGAMYYIRRVEP